MTAPEDGSKSLHKETKVGAVVGFVVTGALTGALSWLANLDTSHWPGYLGLIGVAGVGLATNLITAYLKKNR